MLAHIDGERRAVAPAGEAQYVFHGSGRQEAALPFLFLWAGGAFCHVARAEFRQRCQNDATAADDGLFQRDGHSFDQIVDGRAVGIGDVEFLQQRRGATVYADDRRPSPAACRDAP